MMAGMIVIALFLVVVRKLVLAHVPGSRLVRISQPNPRRVNSRYRALCST